MMVFLPVVKGIVIIYQSIMFVKTIDNVKLRGRLEFRLFRVFFFRGGYIVFIVYDFQTFDYFFRRLQFIRKIAVFLSSNFVVFLRHYSRIKIPKTIRDKFLDSSTIKFLYSPTTLPMEIILLQIVRTV